MKFPIPQDWDNVSWCRWSVCWPASEGWEGFLRGLITLPQRGWTWDERTGSIIDVQQIGREITAKNIPLVGVLMACNDTELADSFNNIAVAIRLLASNQAGGGCCADNQTALNNSIQNFVNQPLGGNPLPVYGSEQPLELEPGQIPEGYDDFAEYDADKCRKANALITATIASQRALGAISAANFAGLSAVAIMAISGVLVVQPYLIPLLIAALVVLAATMHHLDAAADAMQDNYEEWVCTLYEGDNVSGLVGAIGDLLDVLVGIIGVTGPISFAVKTVVLILLNADNLNKLLSSAPMLGVADIDCSSCHWWTCAIGTVLEFGDDYIVLEAIDPGDFDALVAVAYPDTDDLYELEAEVAGWTSPSDHPEFSSSWDTREDACGAGLGYDWQNISASPESGPYAARTFQHRANTTFTVKYTRIIP
jgi:hypothetical protein